MNTPENFINGTDVNRKKKQLCICAKLYHKITLSKELLVTL